MNYKKISEIDLRNTNSWDQDNIFITSDFDWAADFILEDCIKLFEESGVCVTWFITHDTPILNRIRKNKKFEIGIHPNFDYFINPKNYSPKSIQSADNIVKDLLKIAKNAVSVRSHSTTYSSKLLKVFSDNGLKFDCNNFIPYNSNIILKPWTNWTKMLMVPYFWEDDVVCLEKKPIKPIKELIKCSGLKVFDFHPIHIYLNTEDLSRYENTREYHQNPDKLIKYRFKGNGTRTRLMELLKYNYN